MTLWQTLWALIRIVGQFMGNLLIAPFVWVWLKVKK